MTAEIHSVSIRKFGCPESASISSENQNASTLARGHLYDITAPPFHLSVVNDPYFYVGELGASDRKFPPLHASSSY
jgi:hypothetical protein